MHIRAFCEKDYPKLLEIYANSKLDELRFENRKFKLLPLEHDKKRLSALKESTIYVIDDGTVLGYGALYQSEIRAIFVCPSARRKGIGKKLLAFLLSQINDDARLFVAKTNFPAKALYKAYGFEITNEFLTEYNGVPVYANEMVRINDKNNKVVPASLGAL